MLKTLTKTSRVARQRGRPFHNNPLLAEGLPRWRSIALQCLLLCCFLVLGARAVWLQLVSDEFLQKQGAFRYARTLNLPGTRGRILDRDGAMLATSVPAVSVWALPEDLRQARPESLDVLAASLGMTRGEINRKIAGGKHIVYLKHEVDPDVGRALINKHIRGIGQTKEFRRVYPQGTVTSQLVGFVGREGIGLEGFELAHQDRLSGVPGFRHVIRDRLGNIVEDTDAGAEPRPGKDSVLSISSQIQYVAFKQVKEAVEKFQAKAGSAIVVDARTGEILALANYPSYDPNGAGRPSGALLRNRAITDIYEPGSVMKTFTVALAIERGKVRPDSMIDTGSGRFVINGAPISDTSPHGLISVSEVLKYSSNIGTAKLALALPPRDMWEMFTKLGFGQPPQLGFPGAAAGRVRPYASWRPIEQATMSYGNGVAVSLLQLARAYTVFTGEGQVIPLTLEKARERPVGTQVISPATARSMRQMLEQVVTDGTARTGQIAGYRVGGKTGTAYKAENGRYAFPRKYIASFIGIVPMSSPRFIVAVVIDEPSGRYHYGGQVAAPAFVGIATQALHVANIAPDAAATNTYLQAGTMSPPIED
jgi:cell division protein FtsI (penicillin-binding protein 3)